MNRMTIVAAALGFLFLGSAAALADSSWSRSGTAVGRYGGVWNGQAQGSCAGGSCNVHQQVTGPYGGTTTRDRSVTCGGGSCTGTTTVTGPRGGTYVRSGTISRR